MSDDNIKIGRYEIEREIGRGGMAVVYKARDPQLDRVVALKLIRKGAFPPEQLAPMTERFRREAKALAKLNHANIVKVMDYGEHEGAPYLVMEYIEGATLKEVKKPLRVELAVRLIRPIAGALDYVHSQGLLHRDVKPSNIMLTADQRVILTDFGIAKWIEDDEGQATLTGTGIGIGTPEYMAPEQGRGQRVDARTDMYSLTVVFYELITGVKPFRGETPIDILVKQASDPVPDPRTYIPELNESVKRFLDRAMAKKPEDRYPTTKDYLRDLDGLRLQSISQAARPTSGNTGVQVVVPSEPATNSSVRFGRTDLRKVREAGDGNGEEKVEAGTGKNGRSIRKIGTIAAVAAALFIAVAVMIQVGVRRQNPAPVLNSTTSQLETDVVTVAPSVAVNTVRGTAIAIGAETETLTEGPAIRETEEFLSRQSTALAEVLIGITETAAEEEKYHATEEAADLRKTQTAAVQETESILARQATETAEAPVNMTQSAKREVSQLETQIALLGKTATFAVALTETVSNHRSQETSEAKKLSEAATATAANRNPYSNLRVGDTIEFGRYEQDNDLTNGVEPIAWIVLDVSDGSALLISRYGLEKKGYHEKFVEVTWETCSLRNWLNAEFYEGAFNSEERRLIESTRVLNADNPVYDTPGGNSTNDKVFLLSLSEVRSLFSGNRQRIGKPTYYAEARGAWTSKEEGYVGNAWWWLRSGGLDAKQAARIFPGGAPDDSGAYVNDDRGVVRPAIRIRIGSAE